MSRHSIIKKLDSVHAPAPLVRESVVRGTVQAAIEDIDGEINKLCNQIDILVEIREILKEEGLE